MAAVIAKLPTPESVASGLIPAERVLLFCLASGTDWQKVRHRATTAQQAMVRGLIERGDGAALVLTDQGRSLLEVLMTGKATWGA